MTVHVPKVKQASSVPVSTEVHEYILDNGLTVWLNEDHSQPKVFGAVVGRFEGFAEYGYSSLLRAYDV